MNCPVCKCPNPDGATHCNMCYEVFNRSAAQTYMQAMRRERRAEGMEDPPEAVITSQKIVDKPRSELSRLNWAEAARAFFGLARQYWKWPALAVALIGGLGVFQFVANVQVGYKLMGRRLAYAYPTKAPLQYLVGMNQQIKIWSERQGRLDTPIETQSVDEMGNLIIEKTPERKSPIVLVKAREWIQILKDDAGSTSRTIPLSHPSLSSGRIVFDKKGRVLERRFRPSPRMGKSISFLVPKFPAGSFKEGRTWEEPFEWLDQYSGWQVRWSGKLRWTMGKLAPCGQQECAELLAVAELTPALRGVPGWAEGSARSAQGHATGHGKILFDASNKRLVSHTFSYDGLLRAPIQNLDRIPLGNRVGRPVKGPGEILIRFDNKVDIRKN